MLLASPKMAIPTAAKEYETHEYSTMIFSSIAATVVMVSSSFRSCGNTVISLVMLQGGVGHEGREGGSGVFMPCMAVVVLQYH